MCILRKLVRKLSKNFDTYVEVARHGEDSKSFVKFIKDVLMLTVINLKEIRLSGVFAAILSILLPVGIVIFMSIAQPNLPLDVRMRFIIGNVLVSVLQTCVSALGGRIAQIKWYGGAEYYFVLPISRISLMYGLLLNHLILTIPGILAVLTAGAIFYNVTYHFSPLLILVFVEMILALCGIGMFIGMKSRHPGKATALAQGASFFLMFGTPVYYSVYALPHFYRYFVRLMPTTYASDAVAQIIRGIVNQEVWLDVLALGIFSVISLFIISRATKWTEF